VPEATMAKRLTRSKQKIKANRIPYRVPADAELPGRLRGVLATLYLVFNEGYLSSSQETAIRADLCAEAIRLTRILASLMPDEPEVQGLLALMLLTDSRRAARVADGVLVPLPDQDRTRWDHKLITDGHAIVRACLRRNRPGPYQLLAAINAVHTDAATAAETDWSQIVQLYDQLYAVTPTPPEPNCSGESVGQRRRSRRTCGPSTSPPTPPSRPTSSVGEPTSSRDTQNLTTVGR
jgi:RNA polymerase sigma-70 factor (ECF subfamily)